MRSQILRTLGAAGAALVIAAGAAQAQGQGQPQGSRPATPPGLEKKGGLPPGQAKKYTPDEGVAYLRDAFPRHGFVVVKVENDDDSRLVHYRLPSGEVRVAKVRPGADRLRFISVPVVVLRDVVGRMY